MIYHINNIVAVFSIGDYEMTLSVYETSGEEWTLLGTSEEYWNEVSPLQQFRKLSKQIRGQQ